MDALDITLNKKMVKIKGLLIGGDVDNSQSPQLYAEKNEVEYYHSVSTKYSEIFSFEDYISTDDYNLINITNPYKKIFLSENLVKQICGVENVMIDDEVKKFESVNLIIIKSNIAYLFFTDAEAFKSTIDVEKYKNIQVYGTGAMAQMINKICGAKMLKRNEEAKGADYVINATPATIRCDYDLGYFSQKQILSTKDGLEMLKNNCNIAIREFKKIYKRK